MRRSWWSVRLGAVLVAAAAELPEPATATATTSSRRDAHDER